MAEISIHEWTGSSRSLTRTATLSATSSASLRRNADRFTEARWRISRAYFPEGLSTYIRCMLSTQSIASAIGVGEQKATGLGATFQVIAVVLLSVVAWLIDNVSTTFFTASRILLRCPTPSLYLGQACAFV